MNYEFHVGDYVETVGGFVGWISDIQDNNYIVITNDNNVRCGYYLPQEDKYFKHIGAYDFTKKEQKKIEPLDYIITETNMSYQLTALKSKINTLVDAVNKLIDKENNE